MSDLSLSSNILINSSWFGLLGASAQNSPSNTNLKAGDVIKCLLPKISRGDKNEVDQDQSGLYMIKELCHHFDTDGSYTSLKLIRDTFGLHGTNNKA